MPQMENAIRRLIDEAAIRDVIARFADTATRADFDGFRAVWAPDAVWEIPEPFHARAKGIEEILGMMHHVRDEKTFFIQFAAPGPIEIDGDEAKTRTAIQEAASGGGGIYYRVLGMFFDRLRRLGDGWVFTERAFKFLWLDTSPFTGDAFRLENE